MTFSKLFDAEAARYRARKRKERYQAALWLAIWACMSAGFVAGILRCCND